MSKKWYKVTAEVTTLCSKLAEARVAAGMSQEEVAILVDTHQTNISKIDSGRLPTVMGEGLAAIINKYASLLKLPEVALESVGRGALLTGKKRTGQRVTRRRAEPTAIRVPNEAAQLGVLNLVAAGSLKPEAALTLLKSL